VTTVPLDPELESEALALADLELPDESAADVPDETLAEYEAGRNPADEPPDRDEPEWIDDEDDEPGPHPPLLPLSPLSPQSGWDRAPGLSPPSPLCPQSDDWPSLDPAALHGLAGEIVAAIGPHTEADPVALLLTLLTGFGAAVGRGPHALADGAEHPGRLFTVLVGDTAKARKGTSWAQTRRLLAAADPAFTEDRILGGFGSGEALVDGLAESADKRLLVIEPEWARLLAVGRRDGSTISPLLRQAWDGDRLAIRSRGAGVVTADGAHVALLGHVTAEELRAKLVDTEVSNGYANRHLFALVKRSKLLPSGGGSDAATVEHCGRLLRDSLAAARKIGTVRRTPEAEAEWAALYYAMADDEPGGLLGSIIARDAAQVLRLSLIYGLMDGSQKIDVAHVRAAAAVWTYCRESSRIIFGDSIGNPVADRLLVAICAAGREGLTGREIDRALSGHASKSQIAGARAELERRGLVVTMTEHTGGRPSTRTVMRSTADKADEADKGPSGGEW